MDWRPIASILTLVAGVGGVSTWLAFALTNSGPGPVAKVAPAAPSLLTQRPTTLATVEAPRPTTRPAAPLLTDSSMDPRPPPQPVPPPEVRPPDTRPHVPKPHAAKPHDVAPHEVAPQDTSGARQRRHPTRPAARDSGADPANKPSNRIIDADRTRPPPVLTRPRETVTAKVEPSKPLPAEAPAPAVAPPRPDPRYAGLLTTAEISRIRGRLKLSGEQMGYWRPIEGILRELGRKQIAQVNGGRKPDFELTPDQSSRLYSVASPLLMSLRDDQKAEARKLARSLGLESVASMI